MEKQENSAAGFASDPPGTVGAFEPVLAAPAAAHRTNGWLEDDQSGGGGDADETIFTVLAGRARTHATTHLWLTAGIGGVDAAALMIGRPSLWWVAAACAAVTSYAVWGLADRALTRVSSKVWTPLLLRGIMSLALLAGVVGAFAAGIGLLGVVLGKSPPTG